MMGYFFNVLMVFSLSTITKGDIHSVLRDLDETMYNSNRPETLSTLDDYRRELIKEEILSRLGLSKAPNISRKISLPTQIMQNMLLKEASGEEKITTDNNNYYGITKQVVVLAETENDTESRIPEGQILRFNIEHSYETITSVALVFRRDQRILTRRMLRKDNALTLRFLKGDSVRTSHPEYIINKDRNWVMLNVSKESLKLNNEEDMIKNVTVEIICQFCWKRTFLLLEESSKPFLILNVKQEGKQRTKRSSSCDRDSKTCCIVKYPVKFSDLGWGEWIIVPKIVDLDYCKGSCGDFETQNSPFNLLMERFSRSPKNTPLHEPCCVVTKMASISILYRTGGTHIVKEDLPNMTALECQCT